MNEADFFQDLAMMMTVAGLASVVFAKLRWPKVIGYILVGILLNEHTWGGSFLVNPASISTLGQLGAVFLMFALGLEFSTREMNRLKSVTFPVAILDTVVMTWLGYTVGTRILGWGAVPSLFLGAAICDSATTMLAKVIGEMKWGGRSFVKYAIGTSVCEDLITVGIIAIVTGVAAGNGLSLSAAGTSLGALFVFLLAVVVFGFVLVPRLLVSVAKAKDDEMLLLTILGCLFLVSYVAYRFQFSLSVGAFLVGILGAASDVRNRIATIASPLKDMFAAVFFVSVGLLFDPFACLPQWHVILMLSLFVIVGKFVNCTFAALATGERVKTSVQMGMSLAQIGEFAFLVAILYLTATHDHASPMYQIVIAVSLLTTILNPLMIRLSEPVGAWAERRLPARIARALETYQAFLAKYRAADAASAAHREVRVALIRLGVVGALEFAVATLCYNLSRYDYSRFSTFFERYDNILFFILSDLLAFALVPFVIRYARQIGSGVASVFTSVPPTRTQAVVQSIVRNLVVAFAVVVFFGEVAALNVNIMPDNEWVRSGIFTVMLIVAIAGWRHLVRAGHRAVSRFNEALGAEDRRAALARMTTLTVPVGTFREITIDLASPAVGGNVVSLDIRAKTGASIVAVDRDGARNRNIGPAFAFRAGDTLVALADDAQFAALKELLGGLK